MATAVASPPGTGGKDAPERSVRPRRSLPAGRAVVGGFLVALSLVGIFAAHLQATERELASFVVARRNLPIGTTVTEADLALAPMELPDALASSRTYRDPAVVVGATVVGPIGRGELVQASSLLRRAPGASGAEISFPVASAHAVGGRLVPGEQVDVLVTYGAGGDAYTIVAVRGARIVAVDDTGSALADGDAQVVTVVVQDRDALALTHAVAAGRVTLVRGPGSGADAPAGYRTPPPEPNAR